MIDTNIPLNEVCNDPSHRFLETYEQRVCVSKKNKFNVDFNQIWNVSNTWFGLYISHCCIFEVIILY